MGRSLSLTYSDDLRRAGGEKRRDSMGALIQAMPHTRTRVWFPPLLTYFRWLLSAPLLHLSFGLSLSLPSTYYTRLARAFVDIGRIKLIFPRPLPCRFALVLQRGSLFSLSSFHFIYCPQGLCSPPPDRRSRLPFLPIQILKAHSSVQDTEASSSSRSPPLFIGILFKLFLLFSPLLAVAGDQRLMKFKWRFSPSGPPSEKRCCLFIGIYGPI